MLESVGTGGGTGGGYTPVTGDQSSGDTGDDQVNTSPMPDLPFVVPSGTSYNLLLQRLTSGDLKDATQAAKSQAIMNALAAGEIDAGTASYLTSLIGG